MRMVDPARFPNVVDALASAGVDVTQELIPVAPAAHYMMGGIRTDLGGRSTVAGLYAVGESACTGLHGAHLRTDFPDTDGALDELHSVVDASGRPRFERWE